MFSKLHHAWQNILVSVFHKAMISEQKKAKVTLQSVTLAFGKMTFFERSQTGNEEPILMLHGAGTDKDTWLRFAQNLPASYPLVIPDLPAHGDSSYANNCNYGVHAQAQRLVEFIDHLGLKRVHLVGSSMGGALAMQLVLKRPDLFSSLALIDTAGAECQKSWLQLEIIRTGVNPMMQIKNVHEYKTMMRIGMSKPPYIPSIFLPLIAEKRIRRQYQDAHIMRDIEVDMDQRNILEQLQLPTWIALGEQDKIMHVSSAKFLSGKIRESQLRIYPGLGHVPMVENPALLARDYQEFLQSINK
ncbi:MAG: alpha/beta hydrolase [Burkholderiales bacterium]|nr:alpha/beta hydrolase [Burkholderiales bacterium]